MTQKFLPRDLKPGMRIARINAKTEVEFVEIAKIIPVKIGSSIGAYKIITKPWLEGASEISSNPRKRYLAPFTVTSRQKLEVKFNGDSSFL